MPIHGNPGRAVMLLRQLKLLKLSGTLRNADSGNLARFYGSPAVCQSLTTSRVSKQLSKDDRRAVVESYVNEYRAANGGKFPTLTATIKEVGGSFYVVRDILQALKLKPNAPLPLVAKALSEVPAASVPNDTCSQTLNDPQSHSAASNAKYFSDGVVDPVFQADTIEMESDQRRVTVDFSHPDSDEVNLQGNNLVITATHDKRKTETETAQWECDTHLLESQKRIVLEDLKNSEIEEEEIVTHLGSQESKVDHLEGAAISENVVPTEETKITRQVSEKGAVEVETGERSSAWSSILSFAKEFVNNWRK